MIDADGEAQRLGGLAGLASSTERDRMRIGCITTSASPSIDALRIALPRSAKAKLGILPSIHHQHVAALAAQHLVQAQILKMAAVGQVDRLPLIGGDAHEFVEDRGLRVAAGWPCAAPAALETAGLGSQAPRRTLNKVIRKAVIGEEL